MTTFDKNLIPENSPMANNQKQVTSFNFDCQNEAGVISNSKIRNASIDSAKIGTISFSQLRGGTATLGGALDGDGLLTVNNGGGSEVVRLDNTGITITSGTISNVEIGTVNWTSGTIVNSFIGTSQITGGTISSVLVTGGTISPSSYRIGINAGATGTILYLNSGTAIGTIIVESGLITSIA
jgi:hypothetical protein